MADDLRIRGLLHGHKVIERNHLSSVGTQIILIDVFRLGAETAFGLNVNAVGAIVEIEIVYVYRAHVHLKRVGDLAERNLKALGFFAIEANEVLRVVGGETGEQAGQCFAAVTLPDQLIRGIGDVLRANCGPDLRAQIESRQIVPSPAPPAD